MQSTGLVARAALPLPQVRLAPAGHPAHASPMRIDPGVKQRYDNGDEDARLWQPGVGTLVRLRTWDILERMLPPQGRVLDVGVGPGAHAAWLARRGYRVEMLDPIERHLELARARSAEQPDAPFEVRRGVAAEPNVEDGAVDAIVMLGPLYPCSGRALTPSALHTSRARPVAPPVAARSRPS